MSQSRRSSLQAHEAQVRLGPGFVTALEHIDLRSETAFIGPRRRRQGPAVGMSARFFLTAVYEEVEGGWVQARIAELPPVVTAAPTREEAAVLLIDALREYLLSLTDPKAPPTAGDPVEIVLGA